MKIEITGGTVQVDDEDAKLISAFGWSVTSEGYAAAHVKIGHRKYSKIKMHRLIQKAEPGQITDHINGDRLDNRKSNLRLVSVTQNAMNRKSYENSSSQFKGVSWCKRVGKWVAGVRLNGVRHHLGYFTQEVDAAAAYDKKAGELFGQYARLNA